MYIQTLKLALATAKGAERVAEKLEASAERLRIRVACHYLKALAKTQEAEERVLDQKYERTARANRSYNDTLRAAEAARIAESDNIEREAETQRQGIARKRDKTSAKLAATSLV